MAKAGIMDIEISDKNGNPEVMDLWFVAISGEVGPRIDMPISLAVSLKKKLDAYLETKKVVVK